MLPADHQQPYVRGRIALHVQPLRVLGTNANIARYLFGRGEDGQVPAGRPAYRWTCHTVIGVQWLKIPGAMLGRLPLPEEDLTAEAIDRRMRRGI